MDNIQIKPSTPSDIKAFQENIDYTVRAWSVFLNGELVCISGVQITDQFLLAFSHVKQGLAVPKITIWRTGVLLWKKIKKLGYSQIYAFADADIPLSGNFLRRIGFHKVDTTQFGDRYIWQKYQ